MYPEKTPSNTLAKRGLRTLRSLCTLRRDGESKALWGLVAFLLFLLSAQSTLGTVFVKPDDPTLTAKSSWIVEGEVLSAQRAQLAALPAVDYQVRVDYWIRGTENRSEILVRIPGGVRADGKALRLLGAPILRQGQRVLLFLSPRADGAMGPTDLMLGVFHIRTLHGQTVAMRDLGEAHEIVPSGSSSPADGPRRLDRFRAWLRTFGSESDPLAAPDYFLEGGSAPVQDNTHSPSEKYATIISSTAPEPAGCGSLGGHPLRWFDFDGGGVVEWRGFLRGQPGLTSKGFNQLDAALAAWTNDPGSQVEMLLTGVTVASGGLVQLDGTNTVLFDDPQGQLPGSWNGSGLLALAGPWFDCLPISVDGRLFHPILEGDVVTQDGLGPFFAALEDPDAAGEELFAHELGHTLGLAHSEDPQALMYAEIQANGRGAFLAPDDRSAIRFLYGPSSQIEPPRSPSELDVQVVTHREVELTWVDRSSDEDGFRIERRKGDEFEPLAAVGPNSEIFIDEDISPETTYTYRVRAQNRGGASAWSSAVTVTTLPEGKPSAPSNLRAAPLARDRIRLQWQDNASDELEYRLFLLAPGTSVFVEIPTALPADTEAADLVGLTPGTEYTVQVRARNAFGDSEPSNTVSAYSFSESTSCVSGENRLCLLAGRFQVELDFRDPNSPQAPIRRAVAEPSTDQIGHFWFFDPENTEIVVKVLDGNEANGHIWVYYGGITNLEFWLTLTDTTTGVSRTYINPPGEICGGADIQAFEDLLVPSRQDKAEVQVHDLSTIRVFPVLSEDEDRLDARDLPETEPSLGLADATLPEEKAGNRCRPNATTLCILEDRLQVSLRWTDPRNGAVQDAQAINWREDSGTFWFFDPQNTEVVVKAVDGSALNRHLWVFFGALSDLAYEVEVVDTLTQRRKTYINAPGSLCGQADIRAFSTSTTPPDIP